MPPSIRSVAQEALVSARTEIARRLGTRGLPTSAVHHRMVVTANEAHNGWRGESEAIQHSALNDHAIWAVVRDGASFDDPLGLRPQLGALCRLLVSESSLGTSTPGPLVPNSEPEDNVFICYVEPMVRTYLLTLDDLSEDDDRLASRLLAELERLAARGYLRDRGQLALEGIQPARSLDPYRGVTLRTLTPIERGHWLQARSPNNIGPALPDLVVPPLLDTFVPDVVIDWVTDGEAYKEDLVGLAQRLALAFVLRGCDIGSTGMALRFGDPIWASRGQHFAPLPAARRAGTTPPAKVDQREFEAVVDLAYLLPRFGSAEATREEIVLHRVLRGCGAGLSGFIDFAIALEAALLPKLSGELSYRFRLYGALFLAEEHAPEETAALLGEVYAVRSKLVHGEPVPPKRLHDAASAARKLAIAVTLKAVETGWPTRERLERLALQLSDSG